MSAMVMATMQQFLDAFNRHDLDAVTGFFADDCVLHTPRGPQPWGQRHEGRAAVRRALVGRFAGIPDVHYGGVQHWSAGDRGVSQ